MMSRINREDVLGQAEGESMKNPDTNRRGFLGRTAVAAGAIAASVLGVSSGAAARETTDVATAERRVEAEANQLLNRLAADGLIDDASADALPSHKMTTSTTTGVLRLVRDEIGYTVFVLHSDEGRVEVTLPDEGTPYAMLSPVNGDTKEMYQLAQSGSYERIETSLSAFNPDASTSDATTMACSPDTCTGCECVSGSRCLLKAQRTVCNTCEDGDCISTASCGCKL